VSPAISPSAHLPVGPSNDSDSDSDSMTTRGTIQTYGSDAEANRGSAESFAEQAEAAVERSGRFTVAIAGGEEPQPMYALLAEEPLRSRIPWDRVHLFFGDERMVPPGHARSNYGMAHESFISQVPIPEENVHRMRGELDPEEARERYEKELRELFGQGMPRFDLIHLGVGTDGHTASLFPFDDDVLGETERPVRVAFFEEEGEYRLTFTLPLLNAARRVEFLALPGEKAGVVRKVTRGALDPMRLPAQFVRPTDGELIWILGPEAAKGNDD